LRRAVPVADGNAALSQTLEAARSAALDLHEGIVEPHPDPVAGGCGRWPEHLRLRSTEGEVVRGRCRATNLCVYCQRLYVIETVEMLTLDAMEHAPSIWVVLTAREHLTRAECRGHLEAVRRSVRKRWPAAEWFVQVEFQRRGALHLNLLVKGVGQADADELRDVVVERWCARVDALPAGQWVEEMRNGYAVTRYCSKMLAHGLKAEQAPPIGWRGHRTSQTRGYLVRPAAVMREEARASLRLKRALWAAREAGWSDPHDIELSAALELAEAAATSWKLVQILPAGVDLDAKRRREAREPLRR
jgi:hypothetical protein